MDGHAMLLATIDTPCSFERWLQREHFALVDEGVRRLQQQVQKKS